MEDGYLDCFAMGNSMLNYAPLFLGMLPNYFVRTNFIEVIDSLLGMLKLLSFQD